MKEKISILIMALLLVLNLFGCDKAADGGKDKDIKDLSRPAQSTEAETKDEDIQNKDEVKEETVENDEKTDGSVVLSEVRQEILDKCKITDSMSIETEALSRLYAIDSGKVKQSASFVTMSGTFPHEVIMIEAKDSSAADEIVSLLENRLSEVKLQSQSYDAKNYALALECKVVKNGNFVSMFLSPTHKEITAVYNQYIK